jgi:hypothetical protein
MIRTASDGFLCQYYLIVSSKKFVKSRVLNRGLHSERTYRSPVLLAGRQLECLTNSRYRSGGHLVRSYPDPAANQTRENCGQEASYRYSVVFVLRAHAPILVNTDELTTPLTGIFSKPMKGIRAGALLKNIQADHFNINAGIEERDEQRRKLAEKKKDEGINIAVGKDP